MLFPFYAGLNFKNKPRRSFQYGMELVPLAIGFCHKGNPDSGLVSIMGRIICTISHSNRPPLVEYDFLSPMSGGCLFFLFQGSQSLRVPSPVRRPSKVWVKRLAQINSQMR